RLEPFRAIALREFGPVIERPELGGARVGFDALAHAAPQPVERHVGSLADEVPERLVDEPEPARMPEDPRMALRCPHLLPDKIWSDIPGDVAGMVSIGSGITGQSLI